MPYFDCKYHLILHPVHGKGNYKEIITHYGRNGHLDQREALPWFSKIAPGVDPPAKWNIIL